MNQWINSSSLSAASRSSTQSRGGAETQTILLFLTLQASPWVQEAAENGLATEVIPLRSSSFGGQAEITEGLRRNGPRPPLPPTQYRRRLCVLCDLCG